MSKKHQGIAWEVGEYVKNAELSIVTIEDRVRLHDGAIEHHKDYFRGLVGKKRSFLGFPDGGVVSYKGRPPIERLRHGDLENFLLPFYANVAFVGMTRGKARAMGVATLAYFALKEHMIQISKRPTEERSADDEKFMGCRERLWLSLDKASVMEKSRHRKKLMESVDSIMDDLFQLHISLGFSAMKVEICTWAPLGSDRRNVLQEPDTAAVEEVVAGLAPAVTPHLVDHRAVVDPNRPHPNDPPKPEPPGTPNRPKFPDSRPKKHGRDSEGGYTGSESAIRKDPCSESTGSPAGFEEKHDRDLKRCRVQDLMEERSEGCEDGSQTEHSNEVQGNDHEESLDGNDSGVPLGEIYEARSVLSELKPLVLKDWVMAGGDKLGEVLLLKSEKMKEVQDLIFSLVYSPQNLALKEKRVAVVGPSSLWQRVEVHEETDPFDRFWRPMTVDRIEVSDVTSTFDIFCLHSQILDGVIKGASEGTEFFLVLLPLSVVLGGMQESEETVLKKRLEHSRSIAAFTQSLLRGFCLDDLGPTAFANGEAEVLDILRGIWQHLLCQNAGKEDEGVLVDCALFPALLGDQGYTLYFNVKTGQIKKSYFSVLLFALSRLAAVGAIGELSFPNWRTYDATDREAIKSRLNDLLQVGGMTCI